MSYTKLGVRYRRLRRGSHVHRAIWRRDWKVWVLDCQFDTWGISHGQDVADDEPVTCSYCDCG